MASWRRSARTGRPGRRTSGACWRSKVSLSEDVRGELAAIEPRKPCCRLAELSALVRTAGSAHLRGGGRIGVHVELASAAVARRAFTLLRAYGVACEIRAYR